MADEENVGGLEAVIKVTLDDSNIEGQAERAAAKASKAKAKIGVEVEDVSAAVAKGTRGKKVKVPAEITVDPAQATETVKKATRGKKPTVSVTPVVEDSDLAKLKSRLAGAKAFLGVAEDISRSDKGKVGEGAQARAYMGELRQLIRDLSAEVKRREGGKGAAPRVPVTDQRIDELAKFGRTLQHAVRTTGSPAAPAAAQGGTPQPVVVVTTPVAAASRVARATHTSMHGSLQSQLRQVMQLLHPVEAAASEERKSTAGTAIDPVTGQRYSMAEERAARGSVTPTAGTSRAMGRVPMERTTRRGPLRPIRGTGTALRADDELGPIGTRDAAPVLEGQVGTAAGSKRYRRNREQLEAAARRGEAPVTEDTWNPIGERTRQRAPRRGPVTVEASQEFGRPGARGPGGVPPGEPIAKPRGRLRKILDALEGRRYEDFFQTVDETGTITGPAERAGGTLAEAIKVEDPGYKQFAHEGRYYQRVSPHRIAEMEREKYLEEVERTSGVPKLALIGKGGPLGAARTSRRKGETREQELARRGERQRFRARTQARTKEDVYRFNAWLTATKSGVGIAPAHTGFMNVAENIIPSEEPEPLSDAERATAARLMSAQAPEVDEKWRWAYPATPEIFSEGELTKEEQASRLQTQIEEGRRVKEQRAESDRIRADYLAQHPELVPRLSAEKTGALLGQARRKKAKDRGAESRTRIDRARGAHEVWVDDPTTAGLGTRGRKIKTTVSDSNSAEIARDVAEVINERLGPILKDYEAGVTMTDRGPFGEIPGQVGKSDVRTSGEPILRGEMRAKKPKKGDKRAELESLGSYITTLSPLQTARQRFGQLLYDVTRSAKYSEKSARGYQTGRLKIGAATKLDPEIRTYLSGVQQTLGHEAGAKRDAAEHLDSLQREPRALGEKKKTWTEQDEPLEKLEQRLAEISAQRNKLSKTQEFTYDKEGEKIGSPEAVAAAREEDAALVKEQRSLRAKRVWLRRKQEAAYERVALQTGGKLQGERGGVLGIVKRDRTESRIARGRRIAGIDELVPSRGRASFSEPRQNTGDEYAETVNATVSGAGVNLTATPTRPAEEPIPEPLITPKPRFPLQNTTGAPVAGGRARAGGGGRGAAPTPTDVAAPGGDGGGRGGERAAVPTGGGGTIDVRIVGQTKTLVVAMAGARAGGGRVATDRDAVRARRIEGEWAKSLAGEPLGTPAAQAGRYMAAMEPGMSTADKAKKLRELGFTEREAKEFSGLRDEERAAKATGRTAKPSSRASFPTEGPAGPAAFTLVGEPETTGTAEDEFGGTGPALRKRARRARRREEQAEQEAKKQAKAAEEQAARLNIAGTAPAPSQAKLLSQMRKSGIKFTPAETEPRPFEGKSPARIQAESEILEARALNPTRAFQTAVAAAFAKTLGGGGEFEKRVKVLTRALNERADVGERRGDTARELLRVRTDMRSIAKIADEMTAAGKEIPASLAEYGEGLKEQQDALRATAREQRGERAAANQRVAQSRKDLISPLGIARGFGALGFGAIAGGVAYNAASTAVNAALATMTDVLGKFADELAGWTTTASRTAAELANAVRQNFGNVPGAVAGVAAPSGITAERLAQLNAQGLSGRASAIAAAQARVQESDLARTAQNIGENRLPGGFDKALFEGTGGLLGTNLLAPQPGFLERIAGDVSANRKGMRVGDWPQAFGDIAGSGNPFGENFLNPYYQADKRAAEAGQQENVRLFDELNDQLKRAGSGFEFLSGATEEQKQAMIASADQISESAGNAARDFAAAGYAVVGPNQANLSGTQFGNATVDLSRGQQMVPLEVAFEADKRQLEAQFRQVARETKYETGTVIPRTGALERLAAPAMDVVEGKVQPTGLTVQAGAGGAAEQQLITEGIRQAQVSQNELNQRYAAGEQILKEQLKTITGSDMLFNSIKSTGQQIAAIQADIADAQGRLQTHEYNNQLRIAKRTVQDIAGLSGKNSEYGKSQLGIIERENVMLSRQSELLGQMLQQRQINFQLAVAGFQVAGQSPEERAARMKDAKTQAEFAQKQLNIQKQMFGNNIQLFDLQNVRAMQDALASIALLKEGREVSFKTTLAEKNLARLNKIQENNVKQAGAYLSAVDKGVQIEYAELYKLEAAYGKAVQGISMDTISWFNTTIESMYKTIGQYGRSSGGYWGPRATAGTGPTSKSGYASGYLGTVSGATSMIMGEAGTETVAILRNPRTVTPTTGGSGGGVTININHPTIREDGDIQKITRSVINAINTRTALLGLR